jgi:hypothetical protein
MTTTFAKTLSANDVGATGSHQAGILVPRTNAELMEFFPRLDPKTFNPDAWIDCIDEDGFEWRVRYIYYNGRLHDKGTRNEYRLTHLTGYLKTVGARSGDSLVFSRDSSNSYRIRLLRDVDSTVASTSGVVVLRGWNRVH